MPELLSEHEQGKALGTLPHWSRVEGALVREVELESFPEAIAVVNRVAEVAESADHHPDIDIRWRTLKFTLSTHSEGGITQLDVTLATEIDGILDVM
ncbi:4a-hydroxytetrahydrobiopterin dehydratase [Actinokineospora bangkokensis]|uniref:Putative pterin-4-alpha-carbinolamine dehydratase n=1 Tax=Actinokineospora bangkokensis TaxID=1193682 RepID=A0A1Q9LDJ2_9PSEU|nr:4a-hydroxytetrahydrobiopterin dehydratase [Actinokineospora bangkokensis]OLR90074.1 4a-hydroxytetrahydrobiopterin dehydratase [Actinokineospora bangkokensis]